MNPSKLLQKAPPQFDDGLEIVVYAPRKLQDKYGYQYLLKGEGDKIRGSIHKDSFFEQNNFGRFSGDKTMLSTSSQLSIGDLVLHNETLYAIESQVSFNKVMDLKHYNLYSAYDYYKEFIIDSEEQSQRILGANSMRYWLSMDSEIPLLPSMFAPLNNQNKFISINIYNTTTLTPPFKNKDGFLQQTKIDMVELTALNLDTNALQEFGYKLLEKNINGFGLLNYPNWEQDLRYNKEFDLKANLYKADIEVCYSLIATNKQAEDKLIKEAFIQLTTSQGNIIKKEF